MVLTIASFVWFILLFFFSQKNFYLYPQERARFKWFRNLATGAAGSAATAIALQRLGVNVEFDYVDGVLKAGGVMSVLFFALSMRSWHLGTYRPYPPPPFFGRWFVRTAPLPQTKEPKQKVQYINGEVSKKTRKRRGRRRRLRSRR